MHPGDALSAHVRRAHLPDDLVEGHRRGVDHPHVFGRACDHLARNEGARVEHDRTRFDQPAPAHRDQLGVAGTGPDEVHGHGARRSPGPESRTVSPALRRRGTRRRVRRSGVVVPSRDLAAPVARPGAGLQNFKVPASMRVVMSVCGHERRRA